MRRRSPRRCAPAASAAPDWTSSTASRPSARAPRRAEDDSAAPHRQCHARSREAMLTAAAEKAAPFLASVRRGVRGVFTFRGMSVRDLQSGEAGRPVLLVRSRRAPRQKADGREYLRVALGDRTGSRSLRWSGTASRRRSRLAPHRRTGPRPRPLTRSRALRQSDRPGSLQRGAGGHVRPAQLATSPVTWRRPAGGANCASWWPPCATPTSPSCSIACSAPTARRGRSSATRPPPSTTTRPTATACSSTRWAWRRPSARSARRSPASTATSPSPVRCCMTSARRRPTRSTGRLDRLHGRRAGCMGEIPLGHHLVRARWRRSTASPRSSRAPLPHHPLPPRVARARQPRRALHARGDARAHDRQPRRPPRQLRSARARSSRPETRLVAVRQWHRRQRVISTRAPSARTDAAPPSWPRPESTQIAGHPGHG